jgi:hypothetical protein
MGPYVLATGMLTAIAGFTAALTTVVTKMH